MLRIAWGYSLQIGDSASARNKIFPFLTPTSCAPARSTINLNVSAHATVSISTFIVHLSEAICITTGDPYQNTWFDTVNSLRIWPRSIYDLQTSRKQPFDTPSSRTPSCGPLVRALTYVVRGAFQRAIGGIWNDPVCRTITYRIHRNRQRPPSNGSIERAKSTSPDFTLLRKRASDRVLTSGFSPR
jgi:hypothetical protein